MDADRNFAILIPKNRRTCLAKQDQAGSYVRVATSFMINVLTSNQWLQIYIDPRKYIKFLHRHIGGPNPSLFISSGNQQLHVYLLHKIKNLIKNLLSLLITKNYTKCSEPIFTKPQIMSVRIDPGMHRHFWMRSCELLVASWVNKLHLHFFYIRIITEQNMK